MTQPFDVPVLYGFNDLHGFKDFVSMVIVCAPDQFLPYDWLPADEQMTLERAFTGIEYGFRVTECEKGSLPILAKCRELAAQSLADYRNGHEDDGRIKLEQMEKLIRTVRSQ